MITLTAPVTEPVSLIEAKLHLKLITDPSDTSAHPDDDRIEDMISAAREYCEQFCDRAFADGSYSASGCDFGMALLYPVASITSVKYLDTDGAEQTLNASVYELNADLDGLRLKVGQVWPALYAREDAVRVVFATTTPVVPFQVKAAMLLLVGTLYENRSSDNDRQTFELPLRVQDLIHWFRRRLGV